MQDPPMGSPADGPCSFTEDKNVFTVDLVFKELP